jgi:Mn2+/Fe2+ NRAMP family transporter
MAVMMLLASDRIAMAGHRLSTRLRWLGWLATAVMAATVLATWLTD